MKTADLVAGLQTDALVALARDWFFVESWHGNDFNMWENKEGAEVVSENDYSPSTNPAQWAELQLIFRVRTAPMYQDGDLIYWTAGTHACLWDATTLGLAICKAVIAAKFGDEIPTEIWEEVK